MALTPGNEKGISRIDSGSTHGWFVRGYRNGKTYSKLFSDLKCGGREQALELARDYRDKLHDDLQRIPTKPRQRNGNEAYENTSSISYAHG